VARQGQLARDAVVSLGNFETVGPAVSAVFRFRKGWLRLGAGKSHGGGFCLHVLEFLEEFGEVVSGALLGAGGEGSVPGTRT
jgi:hypothetical protein